MFGNVHYPQMLGPLPDRVCLCQGSPEPLADSVICWEDLEMQHTGLLIAVTSVGRHTWHKVWGNRVHYPTGVTQDALHSSSIELWQHMWNFVYRGSSSETVPSSYGAWSHLCLAPRSSRPPRGKHILSLKPIVSTNRHSEILLSGNGENLPEMHIPRGQPRTSLASGPFEGSGFYTCAI